MAGTTNTTDIWVSGTEVPEVAEWMVAGTDEGAQEMGRLESRGRVVEQRGARVVDDWIIDDAVADDERMIVNMGPQHPSTHGVLRLNLELEGELVRRVKPIIGYLHTGMEKTAETLTFAQGGTNVTRMDYLAPLHNELCYSLAVEKLLGVEIPPRAQAIRILLTELNRISSHLVATATNGMDIGALSMMMYGFRERELILEFFEKTTGLRMNHNFIRPGGVAADLPDGWEDDVAEILERIPAAMLDYEDLLKENSIWKGRTQGVGIITDRGVSRLRHHGSDRCAPRESDWDLRQVPSRIRASSSYDFDVDHRPVQRGCLRPLPGAHRRDAAVTCASSSRSPTRCRCGDYKTDRPQGFASAAAVSASTSRWKRSSTTSRSTPKASRCLSRRGVCGHRVASRRTRLLSSSPMEAPRRCACTRRAPSFANLQALPIMMADSARCRHDRQHRQPSTPSWVMWTGRRQMSYAWSAEAEERRQTTVIARPIRRSGRPRCRCCTSPCVRISTRAMNASPRTGMRKGRRAGRSDSGAGSRPSRVLLHDVQA